MYVQIAFSSPKKVYAIELQTSTITSSTGSSENIIAVETDINGTNYDKSTEYSKYYLGKIQLYGR